MGSSVEPISGPRFRELRPSQAEGPRFRQLGDRLIADKSKGILARGISLAKSLVSPETALQALATIPESAAGLLGLGGQLSRDPASFSRVAPGPLAPALALLSKVDPEQRERAAEGFDELLRITEGIEESVRPDEASTAQRIAGEILGLGIQSATGVRALNLLGAAPAVSALFGGVPVAVAQAGRPETSVATVLAESLPESRAQETFARIAEDPGSNLGFEVASDILLGAIFEKVLPGGTLRRGKKAEEVAERAPRALPPASVIEQPAAQPRFRALIGPGSRPAQPIPERAGIEAGAQLTELPRSEVRGALPGRGVASPAPEARAELPRGRAKVRPRRIDREIEAAHNEFGGSTFDPTTGKNKVGEDVWVVSPFKDREVVIEGAAPTAADIAQFRVRNSDLLKEKENLIGTWFDRDTGRHVLDVVQGFKDKQRAVSVGLRAKQDAIFNLKTFEEFRLDPSRLESVRGTATRESVQALAGAGAGAATGGALAGEEGAAIGAAVGLGISSPAFRRRVAAGVRGLGERGAVNLTADSDEIKVAAQFWRQGHNFPKEEFVKKAKGLGVSADPKVYDRAGKLFEKFVEQSNNLNAPKELDDLVEAGFAGASWYDDALKEWRQFFGPEDGEMFAKFFAVTSQQARFGRKVRGKDNIDMARAAFREWKEGVPFGSTFSYGVANSPIVANLNRVAQGVQPRGPKISKFAAALAGDEDAVVVDRWMMRAFGFKGSTPKPNQLRLIERVVKDDAKRFGLTPRQYQAAVWEGALRRAGVFEEGIFPARATFERIEEAGGLAKWLAAEKGIAAREITQAIAGAGIGGIAGAGFGEQVGIGQGLGAAAGAAIGAGVGAKAVSNKLSRREFDRLVREAEEAKRAGRQKVNRAAGQVFEGSPQEFDAGLSKRRAAHRQPKGEPKATTRVQLDKFGLSEGGQKRLQQEVNKLKSSKGLDLKRVSFDEQESVAKTLGFSDVKRAELNRQINGTTLLAMRGLFKRNADELDGLYKALGGAIEGTNEHRRIAAQIDAREAENSALVKMFIPGASEAGRTLGTLRIMAKKSIAPESEFQWRAVLRKLTNRDLSPEELQAVRGALENRSEEDLIRVARAILPEPGIGQSIVNLRRAGFLTGARTQVRNATSNLGELAFRQIDDPLAAGMDRIVSRLLGTQRTKVATSPVARIRASARGARRGISDGYDIARGRKKLGSAELRKLDITSDFVKQSRFADGYVRFMFRLQGAVDQPWRQAAFMESILEQSKRLGLDFDETVRRAQRSIEAGIPDDISLQAMIDAEEAVFQNATAIGRGIEGLKQRLGPGRALVEFFIPFTQTPSAILVRLFERTPFGAIAGVNDLRKLAKALKLGAPAEEVFKLQRRAVTRIGRSATGFAALSLGYMAYQKGIASGGWPQESKEIDRWFQEGKGPDSLFIDGKWRRLTGISPLGNLVAIGAAMAQSVDPKAQSKALERDISFGEAATVGVALTAGRTFVENSFMRGLKDLIETFDTGPEASTRQLSTAQRFTVAQGRSLVPIIVQDVTRLIDPVVRQPKDFVESVSSVLPGLSFDVDARLDEFGRPKILAPKVSDRIKRFFDPLLSQIPRGEIGGRAFEEVNRVGATISRPGRVVSGERLSEEDFRKRQEVIGREREKAILSLIERPAYKRLDEEAQAAAIDALSSGVSRTLSLRDLRPKQGYGKEIGSALQKARQEAADRRRAERGGR